MNFYFVWDDPLMDIYCFTKKLTVFKAKLITIFDVEYVFKIKITPAIL